MNLSLKKSKTVLLFLSAMVLSVASFAEQKVIGKIIDKKNRDEIQLVCVDSDCQTGEFQLKANGESRTLSESFSIKESVETLKRERNIRLNPMVNVAAAWIFLIASTDENHGKGAAICVATLLMPLFAAGVTAEGIVDLFLAPGYAIAAKIKDSRLKKIEIALAGDEVSISHHRFQKVSELISKIPFNYTKN